MKIKMFFGRGMIATLLLALNICFLFAALFGAFQRFSYIVTITEAFSIVFIFIVANSKENTSVKLSWCILIALFPFLGVPLYLYVRTDIGHRLVRKVIGKNNKVAKEKSLVYDASLVKDERLKRKAGYLTHFSEGVPSTGNECRYFELGEKAFPVMLEELEKAKDFIFLEYFIVEHGVMWDSILEILRRKASEGVDVRFIYDGLNTIGRLPYKYPAELEKMGIKCRMFAPIRAFVSTHYNNRDHRKALIIDGKCAFTGGINLADEYINEKEVYGKWKDNALFISGPATRSFTLMFLSMWNSISGETEWDKFLNTETPLYENDGVVLPYSDSPLDDSRVGEFVYQDILASSTEYCYIMTPYLILDREMSDSIKRTALRGVDVRILLPGIPDKKYAYALAKTHYKELLEAGVKIYEYKGGFVHSKVFLSDDIEAVVGTINLDYRSLYLHFENAVLLHKHPVISTIKDDFISSFALSREVTMSTLGISRIERIKGYFLKVFAPLL